MNKYFEEYKEQTGKEAYDKDGIHTEEYIHWLEDRLDQWEGTNVDRKKIWVSLNKNEYGRLRHSSGGTDEGARDTIHELIKNYFKEVQ